jgi:hypothetical protein
MRAAKLNLLFDAGFSTVVPKELKPGRLKMNNRRILAVLLFAALLFGLASIASADDPPKPTNDLPTPTSVPFPPKGSFEPVSIQVAEDFLNPATASVTHLELAKDKQALVPAAPPPNASPPVKGSFAPGPTVEGHFDGETFQILPNTTDVMPRGGASGQEISAASSTFIKTESFELAFPNNWVLIDSDGTTNGQYLWGDVPCFPIESSGSWSGWPADRGADGLDLSPSDCDTVTYPNNMDSWLIYGPFSLADAQSASLDFYYRIVSESGFDGLIWWASTDGTHFHGYGISGTYTSGPFNNGYNFNSFDLTNVPTLGDLSGQSQVWIAFTFRSDVSNTAQGPFLDLISLRKNTDARTYLTNENFDVIDFPNQFWESFDRDGPANGDYRWDDVNCFARSDGWSMWPADNGANAVNVCTGADYPNNTRSWLLHGPFSLAGASEAWVDFYFRNESEQGFDFFAWMASKDGANFSGFGTSGTHTGGPGGNGYNLMRFDLSDAGSLGDLRGESEVWLAFVFESDGSFTGQGPFIDDVSVVVERPGGSRTFLPLVMKAPAGVSLTHLYVKNETTGAVSYTVKNTPQGNITCSNIAAGATVLCGSFTPGPYEVTVSTAQCGSNSGEVYFAAGNVTRAVRCVSD